MSPTTFVNQLASIHLTNVFNPYADICPVHDKKDAAAIRRKNLRNYLESLISNGVDTVWMGRDLGYLGGRRTGLALTDEHHLPLVSKVYEGFIPVRATYGEPIKERTATEVWTLLRELPSPPLLWNVFQFHPHKPDEPFSNRKFSLKERKTADEINAELINWLRIKRVVGIGGDAATYAEQFGLKTIAVRHPSYGGVTDFRQGIRREYRLKALRAELRDTQESLFA